LSTYIGGHNLEWLLLYTITIQYISSKFLHTPQSGVDVDVDVDDNTKWGQPKLGKHHPKVEIIWNHGNQKGHNNNHGVFALAFSLSLSLSHIHSFCSISIVYISCYFIVFALSLLYTYHANLLPPFIWVWRRRRSVLLPQAQQSLCVFELQNFDVVVSCCFVCLFVFLRLFNKIKDLSCMFLHRVLSFFNWNLFCYLLHFHNFVLFYVSKKLIKP